MTGLCGYDGRIEKYTKVFCMSGLGMYQRYRGCISGMSLDAASSRTGSTLRGPYGVAMDLEVQSLDSDQSYD
jgi:hypothetical protein